MEARKVLKYPGSKWNIAKKLVRLVPEHHSYVEPYFGSGAVLFSKPPSDIETVNDLDSDVANLFRCIQQDSERLARLVMTTPFSREAYDRQFSPGFTGYASRYQKAAGFLIKCWQGHGFRTNGYKVGWKNDVHTGIWLSSGQQGESEEDQPAPKPGCGKDNIYPCYHDRGYGEAGEI